MTKNPAKIMQRLLPVGFYDLIFDEAEKSHRQINLALDFFMQHQYRLIKTPLVEFADNFVSEEIANSFLASDVISGKNLAFRNDITLQISRLLDSRLKNVALPLRLCYVGDVLLTKSNELYADRQSTQLGLEIIGCDAQKSNLEIIAISLEILNKFLPQKLLIEFSIPNFANILLEDLGLQGNQTLVEAIYKKDIKTIEKTSGIYADLITQIALRNDDLENLASKIAAKTKSPIIHRELQRIKEIINFVAQNFHETQICCNLFGDDSSYHRDIAFDIFCGDFSYPIARGGRYQINNIDAVGATIYVNRLRKIQL